jgi:hypothetical protein
MMNLDINNQLRITKITTINITNSIKITILLEIINTISRGSIQAMAIIPMVIQTILMDLIGTIAKIINTIMQETL